MLRGAEVAVCSHINTKHIMVEPHKTPLFPLLPVSFYFNLVGYTSILFQPPYYQHPFLLYSNAFLLPSQNTVALVSMVQISLHVPQCC